MKHDVDLSPMTPEKAIKLKGHEIMMRLNAVGVPLDKCNLAALVVALELKAQFIKLGMRPGETQRNERMLKSFDLLEEGIKGYMPMSKEEILSRFVQEIELAFLETNDKSEFRAAVLDIIKNPKTKFKLFV